MQTTPQQRQQQQQINLYPLTILTTLVVITNCGSKDAPVFYFESPGPGMVISPTGEHVQTVSGMPVLTNVSADQCAGVCYSQWERCKCCNGFDYHPVENNGSCYLRSFPTGAGGQIVQGEAKFNVEGWQSYLSQSKGTIGEGYQGELAEYVEVDLTAPAWYIEPLSYRMAYSTLGPNMVPHDQGVNVRSVGGYLQLKNMELLECASECNKLNRLSVCDGFAYNAIKQGTCILKKELGDPSLSTFSNEGWQYFWREDIKGIMHKCFCPCKQPYTCLLCNEASLECSQW